MTRSIRRPPGLAAVLLVAATVVAGCSGGGGPSEPELPEGGLAIIDEGHHNSHTLDGTLAPLGALLDARGMTPIASRSSFRADSLRRASLLVISNALHQSNVGDWSLPVASAFTPTEIEAVVSWVGDGGSLLLIADHMPFPGAARELAAAFGVQFTNSFAFDTSQLREPVPCLRADEVQVFRRSDGSLADHPTTRGDGPGGTIDSIATFTGQAFRPSGSGQPAFIFGPGAVALFPEIAWRFSSATPRASAEGWSQAVLVEEGQGRAGFFGEAAMFTRQKCTLDGRSLPMGMDAGPASQNEAFVRNLIAWLNGEI